jgi:hypothetical protein
MINKHVMQGGGCGAVRYGEIEPNRLIQRELAHDVSLSGQCEHTITLYPFSPPLRSSRFLSFAILLYLFLLSHLFCRSIFLSANMAIDLLLRVCQQWVAQTAACVLVQVSHTAGSNRSAIPQTAAYSKRRRLGAGAARGAGAGARRMGGGRTRWRHWQSAG